MAEYAGHLSTIFQMAAYAASTCAVVRSLPLLANDRVKHQLTLWYENNPEENIGGALQRFSSRTGDADATLEGWLGNLLAGDWKNFLAGARSRGVFIPEFVKMTYNSYSRTTGFTWGDWRLIAESNPALAGFHVLFGAGVPIKIILVACTTVGEFKKGMLEAAPGIAQMLIEQGKLDPKNVRLVPIRS